MELTDLNATYGKLNNASMHLEKGLNIITADNESGKSTWVSFLGDMFYGIPTKDRSFLAHKTRYIPWEGSSMAGTIRFHYKDHDYQLSRSPSSTGTPFGKTSLTYCNTNINVSAANSSNPGEFFFSVPREVFERTAYISQNSIHISQTPDLEKKISSLVSTGDEASFSDAHNILKKQMNQRQYNQSGEIPGIKRELKQIQTNISCANEINQQIQSLSKAIKELSGQLDHINKDIQISYNQQKSAVTEQYLQLQQKIEESNRAILQLQESYPALSPSLLLKLDHTYEQLFSLQEQMHILENEISALEQELVNIERTEVVLSSSSAVKNNAVEKRQFKPRWQIPLLSFLLFILSLVCILFVSAPLHQIIIAIFSICCFIFSSAYLFYYLKKYHAQAKPIEGDTESSENSIRLTKKQELLYKQSHLKDLQLEFQQNWSFFVDHLSSAGKRNITSAAQAQDALSSLHAAQDQLSHLNEQHQHFVTELHYLEKETRRFTDNSAVYILPSDTQGAISSLQSQLHTLRAKRDQLVGELASYGAITELQSSYTTLSKKLESLQSEYEALQIADEALTVANSELEARFSPVLSRHISDIFRTITHGKYQNVFINKDFEVTVSEVGSPVPRDIRLLSQGTIDLLYFSLRMALCLQLYPEDQTPPLIFDDAFVSFDDHRLHAILDYLLDLSQHRQILLFTCHSRESEYLLEKNGVTPIFL